MGRCQRSALAVLCACVGTALPVALAANKKQRLDIASQILGLNLQYQEAQRAGMLPEDTEFLYPNVAGWKNSSFAGMCSDYLSTLDPSDLATVDFEKYGGFFEAGNIVTTTMPMGFTAAQQALGALAFMPLMQQQMPVNALGDKAGCMKGGFMTKTLQFLYLRHLRYIAGSLSSTIVKSREDGSDFVMLTGVSDSSTFGGDDPSWQAPPSFAQKCYFADLENPAADVAAGTATGLALSAKVAMEYGTPADQKEAKVWAVKAERAYAYAKKMWEQHGELSTCSKSSAVSNCKGSGCTQVREDGKSVRGPCKLYENAKPANQYLFTAAAALFSLTGKPSYKVDADYLFDWNYGTFLYNWNNVFTQGLMVLASAAYPPATPAAPAMHPSGVKGKVFYQDAMRAVAEQWSNCSNNGVSSWPGAAEPFCMRTPDGSAYPLDMPWGNLGVTLNGVCSAALFNRYGNYNATDPVLANTRCFMHRQLGYLFNHKCSTPGSSCNTPDDEGFSYMVGLGSHYPTKIHSRDAAYPNFRSKDLPDGNTLCGAIVSGPYAPGPDGERTGRVSAGTDLYTNDRKFYRESEPAVDYGSGVLCALMGYAALPESSFSTCQARSILAGRSIQQPV